MHTALRLTLWYLNDEKSNPKLPELMTVNELFIYIRFQTARYFEDMSTLSTGHQSSVQEADPLVCLHSSEHRPQSNRVDSCLYLYTCHVS